MRKIIAMAFVSLDGVMQAPGGPEEDPTGGFAYGGWTFPYFDEVLGQAMSEAFAKPFDLLLGRKTYEIFAAHWPHMEGHPEEGGLASLFNAAGKHVASRSRRDLSWSNSHWLGEDAVAGVQALKAADGPDLLTQGSSDFLQTLLAADLIDEVRLLVFPVALGSGKRFFGEGTRPGAYTLTSHQISPSGVMVTAYERAGDVQTGSFAMPEPSAEEAERRRALD